MLRQYQAAARGAAAGNSLGPDGAGWSLKDTRDVFPTGQARPMSSRILAVGVMLVGVLVLSVALIMGLEFPKYVHSQLRDDQCVVHDRHPKYPSWRDGSHWNREVRLVYHHLLNEEQFLYVGATPVFEKRGPYIYTEYEERHDVDFSVSEVTYTISRSHVFDPVKTSLDCPVCSENDTLTVLNTDFLRQVYKTGGHDNHLLSILPSSLEGILQHHGLFTAHTLQPNVSLLGCLDSVCDNVFRGDITTSSDVMIQNVSFGGWLRTSGTSFSTVILNSRSSGSFNASEIGAVYRVLLNSSLLGSDLFSPESSLQLLCQTWAKNVCQGGGFSPPPLSNFEFSECGILPILQTCDSSSVQYSAVREILLSAFCSPDNSVWCLDFNLTSPQVLSAYFEAFHDFILQHLPQIVHNFVFVERNNDIVVTRSQRELALGYYVTSDADQSNVHVQGLLDEDWLQTSTRRGLLWKVDTCLKDRNFDNNMRVREFNGSQYAPPSVLKDPMSKVPFSGVTDFFATCSPSTCTICPSPGASLYLFQPSLRRSLYFVGGDSTSLWNTEVFRYWLSPESFSRSLRYDVSCGLQTMTSLLGFVGWIGIPDLDPSLYEKVGLGFSNCTLPQPKSYVDVEPVTGRIWQRRIQLQLHAGLRACDVNGHRLRPVNVTYLDKAVPVVSTDRRAILSGAELSFYNYKVDRLMKVSCGGLIGLSVIAAIVVAIGVVILFKPKKINRVGPVIDGESSASNLNSRHINTT